MADDSYLFSGKGYSAMESVFFIAALWLGLAVIAAIVAYHLDISIALVEICVGVAAGAIADHFFGKDSLGGGQQWLQFLASAGAVLLTFLAGAELDPVVMKKKAKEVSIVGVVGFLTPFYFLRAGTLVSIPALIAAPFVFLFLFLAKVASKIFGLFPVIARFRTRPKERWYYTLMMSTGLTFGTISALFGLSHGIVTEGQYSALVATVIASALIPTFTPTRPSFPGRFSRRPANLNGFSACRRAALPTSRLFTAARAMLSNGIFDRRLKAAEGVSE
jgi:Kef-type K+ transport system membrane component KefB